MELIFGTRGHIDCVEKFIRNLRSVWMKREWTTKEGKVMRAMEMNVKPYQIWSVAFPKEYLDVMLNTLILDGKQHKEDMAKRYPWIFNWLINFIRNKLGLIEIPIERKHKKVWPVLTANVEIFPIGIKEDGEMVDAVGKKMESV